MPQDGYCRSCGAPIFWARTIHGVSQPVDREPTPDGNLVLTEAGELQVIAGPLEVPAGTPVYMPHHATCPDAGRWRKGRK